MNPNLLYLRHIRDAIEQVQSYIGGIAYEEFVMKPMVVDAVIRQLTIVGEATNKLSQDFCSSHTNIPYAKIVSMRNQLIHAYAEIDLDILWDVYENHLPTFLSIIQNILERES